MIVLAYNCEEMHIVALSLKSKGINDIFCISLEWLNAVFGKEIAVGL